MQTKLTEAQLVTNAKALKFDHTDRSALMMAAAISDPEFGERLCRMMFEKALREVAQ